MRRSEMEPYQAALQAKKLELTAELGSREEIAIARSADTLDEVQFAVDRELAICNLDRESKLLQRVRSALHNIEYGTYGVCLHCDVRISLKRLSAVPWAEYCISCQEEADRAELVGEALDRQPELLRA
jgi:DnaK suppressor protein